MTSRTFLRPLLVAAALLTLASTAQAATRQMENLARGMNALATSKTSIYVNWRLLYSDPKGTAFNLYRSVNGAAAVKLNASPIVSTTDWTDGTISSANSYAYFVKPVVSGMELAASKSVTIPANAPVRPYIPIKL